MHNTPLYNLEFNLAWCETNLRYLYGSDQSDPEIVKSTLFMKSEIQRLNIEIKELTCSPDNPNGI